MSSDIVSSDIVSSDIVSSDIVSSDIVSSDSFHYEPPRQIAYFLKSFSIVLVICLACLVWLFRTNFLELPGGFGSFLFIFFLLLVCPAILITIIVGHNTLSLIETISVSFTLSLGIYAVPAFTLLISSGSLSKFFDIILIIYTFLSILACWRILCLSSSIFSSLIVCYLKRVNTKPYTEIFFVVVFTITVGASLYCFSLIDNLHPGTDRLTYQTFLRHFLDAEMFYEQGLYVSSQRTDIPSRQITQTWILVQAAIVNLANVNMLTSYAYFTPAILIICSFLAQISFAKALTGRLRHAVLICVIQGIYYIADINPVDEGMGFNFFYRIHEDKFLLVFVLLPSVLLVSLKYLQSAEKKYLIFLLLGLLALTTTHPLGILFYGVIWIPFLIVNFLMEPRQVKLVRALPVVVLTVTMLVIPLWQRQAMTGAVPFTVSGGLSVRESTTRFRERMLYFLTPEKDVFVVNPDLLSYPLEVCALFSIIILLFYLKRDKSAQFLATASLSIIFLCFTPYVTSLLGRIITPWMIPRLLWLFPTAYILGYMLGKLFDYFHQLFGAGLAKWTYQVFTIVVTVMLLFLLQSRIAYSLDRINVRNSRSLTGAEIAALDFLRVNGERRSNILTPDSRLGDEIPGLIGHSYSITFRYAPPPPQLELSIKAREKFYDDDLFTQNKYDTLVLYDIDYIIVENRSRIHEQLLMYPNIFAENNSNSDLTTFQFLSTNLTEADKFTIQANTEVVKKNYGLSQKLYNMALSNETTHLGAYLGLADSYARQGNLSAANNIYIQLAETGFFTSNNADLWVKFNVQIAMGETFVLLENYIDAVEAFQVAIQYAPLNVDAVGAISDLIQINWPAEHIRLLVPQLIVQYEQILNTPVDKIEPYINLEKLYILIGDEDKVASIVDRALSASIEDSSFYRELGEYYNQQADTEKAKILFSRAIEINPTMLSAYRLLLEIYLAEQDTESALLLLERAQSATPDRAWPHIEYSRILLNEVRQ